MGEKQVITPEDVGKMEDVLPELTKLDKKPLTQVDRLILQAKKFIEVAERLSKDIENYEIHDEYTDVFKETAYEFTIGWFTDCSQIDIFATLFKT